MRQLKPPIYNPDRENETPVPRCDMHPMAFDTPVTSKNRIDSVNGSKKSSHQHAKIDRFTRKQPCHGTTHHQNKQKFPVNRRLLWKCYHNNKPKAKKVLAGAAAQNFVETDVEMDSSLENNYTTPENVNNIVTKKEPHFSSLENDDIGTMDSFFEDWQSDGDVSWLGEMPPPKVDKYALQLKIADQLSGNIPFALNVSPNIMPLCLNYFLYFIC